MPNTRPRGRKAVEGRRDQLLAAALRLMASRGFAATSIEDVARQAGVAKGTVYLYFPTKDALLAAVLETQSLMPALIPWLDALEPGASLPDIVHSVVPLLWQALHARKDALRILLREGSDRSAYSLLFLERTLPFTEQFAERLRVLSGNRAPELDYYVAIRALIAMLLGLFVEQEILGGKKVRPVADAAIVDTVAALFLDGVRGARAKD